MSRLSLRAVALALVMLPLLAACGSKGALYKPASAADVRPAKMVQPMPVDISSTGPTVDADGH